MKSIKKIFFVGLMISSNISIAAVTLNSEHDFEINLAGPITFNDVSFSGPSYFLGGTDSPTGGTDQYGVLHQEMKRDPLSSIDIFAPAIQLPTSVKNGDVLFVKNGATSENDWVYLLRFQNNSEVFLYSHSDGVAVPEDYQSDSVIDTSTLATLLNVNIELVLSISTNWPGLEYDTGIFRNMPGASINPYGSITYLTTLSQTTVPLPGAFWVFGSALIGMISLQRCKSALRQTFAI